MPGQATPCSSIEVVITSTTGNRVAVKSGPRVRISPAAPEKERHPKRGASSFSAQEEIRIEDRQPPGAAGSSGPARTTRRRRGRHIVRGDFLQKSPLTHFVAAPLQIEPAALGFDLVLGAAADYRHRAPVFHRSSKIILFPCFCAYRSVVYAPPKSRHIIAIK